MSIKNLIINGILKSEDTWINNGIDSKLIKGKRSSFDCENK
jgi:hypothetical protein